MTSQLHIQQRNKDRITRTLMKFDFLQLVFCVTDSILIKNLILSDPKIIVFFTEEEVEIYLKLIVFLRNI